MRLPAPYSPKSARQALADECGVLGAQSRRAAEPASHAGEGGKFPPSPWGKNGGGRGKGEARGKGEGEHYIGEGEGGSWRGKQSSSQNITELGKIIF